MCLKMCRIWRFMYVQTIIPQSHTAWMCESAQSLICVRFCDCGNDDLKRQYSLCSTFLSRDCHTRTLELTLIYWSREQIQSFIVEGRSFNAFFFLSCQYCCTSKITKTIRVDDLWYREPPASFVVVGNVVVVVVVVLLLLFCSMIVILIEMNKAN